ncbi:MAG: hypothetical protein LBP73_04445 [Clostridiales Family XIII bacterium]|nr:hypothetical protein [Clostridiales Family XIII bacterium]
MKLSKCWFMLAFAIGILPLFAACGDDARSTVDAVNGSAGAADETPEEISGESSEEPAADVVVEDSFGSYTVPAGWAEAMVGDPSDEKRFYLPVGTDTKNPTTNISVEAGTNRYPLADQGTFRQMIAAQLFSQAPDAESVDAYGVYTENDYPLYVYTIEEKEGMTVQYYIVGEKKHILIHLTVFGEENAEAAKTAAMYIANSFVWPE